MQSAIHPLGIGIIGCGKISQAYFEGAKTFECIQIIACADLNPDAAKEKAEANGCEALSVEALLAHSEIELVINLTIPASHAAVSMQILQAGKHVYSEKPLAIELADAQTLLALASEKNLRVGCAPDTFMGAGIQTCRKLIDEGAIGKVIGGTLSMLNRGHESWHPNPGFYYQKGGGPVFDMAPYYLTALVNLIGPIKQVSAITSKAFESRTATSQSCQGQILPVEVSTHCSATLEFHSGALITAIFSFDVYTTDHHMNQLFGTEGSLQVPDPNTFAGPVMHYQPANKWQQQALSHIYDVNMRGIGVAEMATAIRANRPHRANGALAYHVLEVMHACETSSQSGRHVEILSCPQRPAALPLGLVPGQLDA